MTGSTCATGLTANRIGTADSISAVFHTLASAFGIARVGGGTCTTGLATDWVGATLKVAAIWDAAIFLALTI